MRPTVIDKISIAIVLTGLLAMAMTVAVAANFKRSVYAEVRQLLSQSVARESGHQLRGLAHDLSSLAYALQAETEFQTSYARGNSNALDGLLRRQFQRYFANEGIVRLQRIAVYDTNFEILGLATDPSAPSEHNVACTGLAATANARTGIDRLRSTSELCVNRGRVYFAVIAPIGGLRPTGYVQLESDPVAALASLEFELNAPIRISGPTGQPMWQSENWPIESGSPDNIIGNLSLAGPMQEVAVDISTARDVRDIQNHLNFMLYTLLGIFASVTLGAAIIARKAIVRAFVVPLKALENHMRYVHEDRRHLGEQIAVQGDPEVQQLAATINFTSNELRNLYGTLEFLAITDPETQLPNRLQLGASIDQLMSLYKDRQIEFALMLISVSEPGSASNKPDQNAGNRLVTMAAQRLRECVRTTDVVLPLRAVELHSNVDNIVRLDGNDFAILLPGAGDQEAAATAAANIARHLKTPVIAGDITYAFDVNIGVAIYSGNMTSSNQLIQNAGYALAEARRRSCDSHVYSHEHPYATIQRYDLERDLREALARRDLRMLYQPQAIIKSRVIHRAEALIDWNSLKRDQIPPDELLPLAERAGILLPLTYWMFEQAIRDCRDWQSTGLPIGITVDVEPRCLHDPDFAVRILALLDRYQLPGNSLVVELTERGQHGQLRRGANALRALTSAGVCISVDKFGMGFPTVAELKQLPLSQIKIDKQYVLGMPHRERDATVVRAGVEIARRLGLQIAAEGVDLDSHWETLASLGVDIAQGALVAPPMNDAALVAWVRKLADTPATWGSRSAAN